MNLDIREIRKLKDGKPHTLGEFACSVDASFFVDNSFNVRNVNAKTFILMLASEQPLDFTGAGQIQLGQVLRDCNKREFHHIYPKAYLETLGTGRKETNSLANFCFLTRAANNKLGGKKPSLYRENMPKSNRDVKQILTKALCPEDIFHDDFDRFLDERVEILVAKAKKLIGAN